MRRLRRPWAPLLVLIPILAGCGAAGVPQPVAAPAPAPAAAGPPGAPTNPQPADGATGVTWDRPRLSWDAAPGATGYEVLFGSDTVEVGSDPLERITTSSTAVTIPRDLEQFTGSKTNPWFWRVYAKNRAGATSSAVWSFTTGPAEETPPATNAEAPAWPAAATRLKIEGVVETSGVDRKWKLERPTGNPTPTVSVIAGIPTTGHRWWSVVHFHRDSMTFTTPTWMAATGTITLLAANSAGSATLEVPYNMTCRWTIAETLERLRGTWRIAKDDVGYYTEATFAESGITTVPASAASRNFHRSFTYPGLAITGHVECRNLWGDGAFHLGVSSYRRTNDGAYPLAGCAQSVVITPHQPLGTPYSDRYGDSLMVRASCERASGPDRQPLSPPVR